MTQETATLMMVTYNRLNLTKQTINNIYETINIPFNLVIVDNGSTDETVEYLQNLIKEKNNITLKLNKENKGIAIGRNQALKMADDLNTSFYCTIDNDVLLPQNWLENCINIIKAAPKYGMIGVSFESVQYPLVSINGYEFEHKPKGNCGTACMVFSKAVHKMIGFFSTEFGTKYGEEDSCFGFRAKTAGFSIGHIKEHGTHLGEGENDPADYRKFKDECRKKNLALFYKNCALYAQGKKPIYIPFKDE